MRRKRKFSGEQLRNMRLKAGFTQAEIAIKIGISRETVSAIENEKMETMRHLPVDWLQKWYKVTNHSLDRAEKEGFRETVMNYFGF